MTYGVLQSDIADELARSDLTSQIKRAIVSAIDHYSRERFWFNETTFEVSLSASQASYGSADAAQIAQLVLIDSVRLTVNSNSTYTLIPRDWAYIESVESNTNYTGDPTDYVYYKQELRFYPTPYTARTVRVAGVTKDLTVSLSASDTATNYWTGFAPDLIKARARFLLFRDVIRSPDEAQIQKSAETEELSALKAETTRRTSSNHIRPRGF